MIPSCILVSGSLGYKALIHLNKITDVKAVFCDFKSAKIREFCVKNKIPLFLGNPRNGKAAKFIDKIFVDYLFSINYLFIVDNDLLNLPSKHAINLHGSLLPKYRGRTPHVWSIINGEKTAGVTAHLMDMELDNGDIIIQKSVPIGQTESGADLLNKYYPIYINILTNLIELIETNKIRTTPQDDLQATYFPKRSPEDGLINWNWCSQRIHNWIRAQRNPYPGAFAYFNNHKFSIHNSENTDFGFKNEQSNGTIVSVQSDSIYVKLSDRVVRLFDIEKEDKFDFLEGTKLN